MCQDYEYILQKKKKGVKGGKVEHRAIKITERETVYSGDSASCSLLCNVCIKIPLKLEVYNINIDAGSELLEKSPTLKQYSMFVERVREYSREKETLTERDMVKIMKDCIRDGILPEFLSKYGKEAVGMMFRELTQEEAMEMSRQDGYDLGVEEGIEQGEASGRAEREIEMAKALKDKGVAIDIIAETSGLSKEDIEKL